MPDYTSIYSGEQVDLAVGKVLTPDASPTTNSQNLVTSGGVKAAIDNAASEFGNIETRVENIEGKIPSGASSSNKLATASDVAAKYTKPSGGIPKTDLASAVQTSLGKADSAYQKPVAGIPKTDLASDVQLSLQKADEAAPQATTYTKTEVDEKLAGKVGQNDYAPAIVAGSADGLLGVSKAQEFTFAAVPSGTGNGAARIGKVKGNSLAWNQMVNAASIPSVSERGITITNNGNGYFTINGSVSSGGVVFSDEITISTVNHVFLLKQLYGRDGVIQFLRNGSIWSTAGSALMSGYIGAIGSSLPLTMRLRCATTETFSNEKVAAMAIDLTLMFGAGNEPPTVAEFEALYPELYYAYNAGAIKNNAADTLVSDGFNQWDEEWEVGDFDSYGNKTSGTTTIRSKNYIPVFANTEYYFNGPGNVFEYDASKNFVIRRVMSDAGTFTTTARTAFLMFQKYAAYGNTYNNDICINRSDPARNGQYEPHWRRTLPLALTSLRGRLNGTGERVAIFPDGMKRAGDAYDEVYGNIAIKRLGSVDLGTLEWEAETGARGRVFIGTVGDNAVSSNLLCVKYTAQPPAYYNMGYADKSIWADLRPAIKKIYVYDSTYDSADAATFTTAMDGVMLNYELATPEIYILDEPIPSGFAVGAGGTMHALPDAIEGTPTAPFAADIAFPRDNYGITSKNSTVALLEALKTAGKIASYTIGYDANGDMTFNIT